MISSKYVWSVIAVVLKIDGDDGQYGEIWVGQYGGIYGWLELASVPCQPLLGVELGTLTAQLELQDIVLAYGSESLSLADTLSS